MAIPSILRLHPIALGEVRKAVQSLPKHLREHARTVTITYEDRPATILQADGIESDTLGLFVGDSWENAGSTLSPMPPQIILYLLNLWEFANNNEAEFRREVRRTYLHELGHFLGLEEDDLGLRGLD